MGKRYLFLSVVFSLAIIGGSCAFLYAKHIKASMPINKPLFSELQILVDLTEHKLYVMKKGEIIKKFPIASGKFDTPSPIGDWKIISKDNWGEGFGGYWMRLNVPWGKYGIHGTTSPHSIGGRTSHGCIRMLNKHAKELYQIVRSGMPVKIQGGPFGPFGMGFRTLKPGDRGSDVYEVQVRLKRLGFYDANPDGVYGEYTKKTIFRFQKKHDLPLNNYLDKIFYDKLNIILFE